MKNFLFILILLSSACSPKLVTHYVSQDYPMVNSYECFAVIHSDMLELDKSNYIGEIQIKDNGLSINCDYWTVMEQLKTEARRAGGNIVRIDEHKKPSLYGSTCHQIKASIFRVANPRPYEKIISWNPNRKLVVEDFKGSTVNRPFQASTFSQIKCYIQPTSFNKGFDITVRTQFNCSKSYFKRSDLDSVVLAHEQLHFDIAEIYARRFYKRLLEIDLDPFNLNNQVNQLLDDITTELSIKQDEYDAEVYENAELQSKWNTWVEMVLEKLKEYKRKEIKNHPG